jgi:hypothetical protein
MLEYSFLTLSMILAIPGVVAWYSRPDLRVAMRRTMAASLPFALTERLFYPDYWAPKFLFDLVNVIGFGLEDVLFVTGLAAFTTAAWPLVARKTYEPLDADAPGQWMRRATALLAGCFVMVAAVAAAGVPMIYGAPAIMLLMGGFVLVRRPDLAVPAIGGAVITTVVYTAICLALMALIPQVFELDWNTDEFLDTYLFGVPVEEIIYAATSGFVATTFYPFVTGTRFVRLPYA